MKWHITAVQHDANEKKTSLKCDIDSQENQTCNKFWTIVAISSTLQGYHKVFRHLKFVICGYLLHVNKKCSKFQILIGNSN